MATGAATKLVISGLHSADDARRAESALATLPGAYAARVSLTTRVAVIRHGPEVSIAQLIGAVEEAGYRARRAVPGEGSADYASSPWGALRPRGRSMEAEVLLDRSLAFAGAMLLVTQALAMVYLAGRKDHQAFAQFILGTIALAVLGARFYASAWHSLLRRRVGTDFLVAAACTVGYVHSALRAFASDPGRLQFMTVTAILTTVTAGRWLELWFRLRSGRALHALVELAPLGARILRRGQESEVLSCDLLAGDLVVVRPGERFPADGMVVEGRSAADESMLTGEALPQAKHPGSPVLGGTVNGNGRLVIRVGRVAGDTALARMVQVVHEAGRTRPSMARLAERLGFLVGPGAVLVAVAAFLGAAGREEGYLRAMAVLAVACPWALALAVPAAMSAALGRAARLGILIRSGPVLEACARLGAVVFGKTGTLTLGRPELVRTLVTGGADEREMLAVAAALAGRLEHPLDQALAEAARARGLAPVEVSEAESLSGPAVRCRFEGQTLLLGRRPLQLEEGVDLGELAGEADGLESGGHTALILSAAGRARALFAFVDPLKPGADHTVERIRSMGLAACLLSGDSAASARAVGAQAGIPAGEVLAEVRREDRPMHVRAIRERHGPTAMVGEAVEDGPALAEADVGMAVGCGAQVKVESADVVLVGEDLRGVLRALRIARRAVRAMRVNVGWALFFNAAALPLAALGLVAPAWAAAAMVGASLLVAANGHQLSMRPRGLFEKP